MVEKLKEKWGKDDKEGKICSGEGGRGGGLEKLIGGESDLSDV
ncbi:hypothetical protein [Staphylococcus epidermidis]|nr:hypothetical protein [Staphylococcus epidermidis]